ncbi:MAG: hypothetical protein D6803_04825 [Anaerolineae bacterium]|nr:MAG: hypothetical protein D6803_04825 [Anaerolineae bacterium]
MSDGQRITNAEIARRIDALFGRLDEVASGVHDMKTTLRLMDNRLTALEEQVAQHKRVLFGQNGGLDKPGVVDDIRDLRRMVGSVSRALWFVTASILSALGVWLAHTVFGLGP